jgi:hypothetical protein
MNKIMNRISEMTTFLISSPLCNILIYHEYHNHDLYQLSPCSKERVHFFDLICIAIIPGTP